MNKITNPFYIILAAAALILVWSSVYTVNETEQVLVLQFGKPVKEVRDPGLHFKVPIMQNLVYFDKRLLDLNASPREVLSSDKERLIVDSFAKYRIIDPRKFYETVRNEAGIRTRLNTILESRLKGTLTSFAFHALLTGQRVEVMKLIKDKVYEEAKSFGIEVTDVRIMRADLPKEISDAVFRRMQTEREQEAAELRAQGKAIARDIRSTADKQRKVILAEARKQSEIIRGEGDGIAAKTYANAFKRDAGFYNFYRSMQAYRKTLNKDDTSVILSSDSGFLEYLED